MFTKVFDSVKLFDDDKALVMTVSENNKTYDMTMELNIDSNMYDIVYAMSPDDTEVDRTQWDFKINVNLDAEISPLADGYKVEMPELTGKNSYNVFNDELLPAQIDAAANNGNPINVLYNSASAAFEDKPIIVNDRTFVPFRKLANTFGIGDDSISYDEATERVYLKSKDTEITMYIGSSAAYVNGELMILDVPAFTYNDRTYIPVRFVSEMFDKNVGYNETNGVSNVIIND